MEDFAIEDDVNAEVEVLPVPQLPHLISRNALPLDQLALRDAAVSVGEWVSG